MKNPLYHSTKLRRKFLRGLRDIRRELAHRYPCPYPCNGTLVEVIPERGNELVTPRGFKQEKQFQCKMCGTNFIGTSISAVSDHGVNLRLPIGRLQLKAWRANHKHGKWVQKGWRGRKYVFAGYF